MGSAIETTPPPTRCHRVDVTTAGMLVQHAIPIRTSAAGISSVLMVIAYTWAPTVTLSQVFWGPFYIDCSLMDVPLPARMVHARRGRSGRSEPPAPGIKSLRCNQLRCRGPNRPVPHRSGFGWNCQFGRAIPSTSEVPIAMRRHGGISSTCPQCAGSRTYSTPALLRVHCGAVGHGGIAIGHFSKGGGHRIR